MALLHESEVILMLWEWLKTGRRELSEIKAMMKVL